MGIVPSDSSTVDCISVIIPRRTGRTKNRIKFSDQTKNSLRRRLARLLENLTRKFFYYHNKVIQFIFFCNLIFS